jgi:two-component system response regulator ChvI
MQRRRGLFCRKMIRRVLLVDDDVGLTTILGAALSAEGFSVAVAHDGAEALRKIEHAELAILDVLLPEIDGLSLCRRIRKQSRLPLILLSSRGEEIDRVAGLESGADDYVTKPFSTRELCARIRSLDRRLHGQTAPLTAGPVTIDVARFEVRYRDQLVAFTRSELVLLTALVERRGFVLSREQLLESAREGVTITERTVDTFIKRIRKKLREADPAFDQIETIFGVGYRYRR